VSDASVPLTAVQRRSARKRRISTSSRCRPWRAVAIKDQSRDAGIVATRSEVIALLLGLLVDPDLKTSSRPTSRRNSKKKTPNHVPPTLGSQLDVTGAATGRELPTGLGSLIERPCLETVQ